MVEQEYFDEEDDEVSVPFQALLISQLASMLYELPFEVAQVLVQIQSLPRPKDIDQIQLLEDKQRKETENAQWDAYGDANEDDVNDTSSDEYEGYTRGNTDNDAFKPEVFTRKIEVDTEGYILPVNNARPRFQIPPLRSGIWSTIGRVCAFKHEGLLSLWKGITPFYFLSTGRSIIQPYMEDQLNAFFELYDPSIVPLALQTNFWPNLGTSVVSHAVAGFLLSPLDMLRIHFIAQTVDPLHMPLKSYSDAIDKIILPGTVGLPLKYKLKILFKNLYPYPFLTAWYSCLPALCRSLSQVFLSRVLKVTLKSHPLLYSLSLFGMQTIELLIMSPLETIYRRMLVCGKRNRMLKIDGVEIEESKSEDTRLRASCVNLVSQEYKSSWDCFIRILTEEAIGVEHAIDYNSDLEVSSPRKLHSKSKKPNHLRWGFLGGVAQLYRGFWLKTTWNATICMFSFVSGLDIGEESDYFYF